MSGTAPGTPMGNVRRDECATDGCHRVATEYFESGGIGSGYCRDCASLVRQIADASPAPVQAEVVAWRKPKHPAAVEPFFIDAENRTEDWMKSVFTVPFYAHPAPVREAVACEAKFRLGDRVEKISGSSWRGRVVGTYRTSLTPEGYAVESENEPGSVQIYPAAALRARAVKGE